MRSTRPSITLAYRVQVKEAKSLVGVCELGLHFQPEIIEQSL